jgi:predicted RNase H-like nuclease (RuvC/YqgF family)
LIAAAADDDDDNNFTLAADMSLQSRYDTLLDRYNYLKELSKNDDNRFIIMKKEIKEKDREIDELKNKLEQAERSIAFKNTLIKRFRDRYPQSGI